MNDSKVVEFFYCLIDDILPEFFYCLIDDDFVSPKGLNLNSPECNSGTDRRSNYELPTPKGLNAKNDEMRQPYSTTSWLAGL